jgi:hypothetical protein
MEEASTLSPVNKASSAIAVETCVPLIRALFGAECEGFEAEPSQRIRRGHDFVGKADTALADQRGAQMGKRCQIAGRAYRTLGGDQRQGVRLHQRQQTLHDQTPHPAMAAREADGLEHKDQPYGAPVERFAQAAAVREDQIPLKLFQPVVGDPGLGKQSEAGIHAIDGAPRPDDPSHAFGGGIERRPCPVGKGKGRALPDRPQLTERHGSGFEQDRLHFSGLRPSADPDPVRGRNRRRFHSPHRHGA